MRTSLEPGDFLPKRESGNLPPIRSHSIPPQRTAFRSPQHEAPTEPDRFPANAPMATPSKRKSPPARPALCRSSKSRQNLSKSGFHCNNGGIQPNRRKEKPAASLGNSRQFALGGNMRAYLISILRGLTSSRSGRRRVRTPSFSSAEIWVSSTSGPTSSLRR